MNGFSQICLDVPVGTAGPGKRVELIAAGKQEGRVRQACLERCPKPIQQERGR